MIQSLSVKGAEAGARGPRLLGECSTDYGGGRRRSTREPKRLTFPFEPRSENRGVHGILKAVPHVRSTFIFDVHVELARGWQQEVHNLAVVRKLSSWEHDLVRALRIELLQPSTSFVRVHSQPLLNDPEINCSLSVPLRSSTALKRDQLADISLSSTNAAFTPKSGHC